MKLNLLCIIEGPKLACLTIVPVSGHKRHYIVVIYMFILETICYIIDYQYSLKSV